MPPRLNKRQQRQLLEQEGLLHDLAGPPNVHEQPDASDEEPRSSGMVGFAALAGGSNAHEERETEESDQQGESKNKKSKKKKKKKADAAFSAPSNPASARESSDRIKPRIRTHSGKKATGKSEKDAGDDLDRALAELSLKYPDLKHAAQSSSDATGGAQDLAARQQSLLAVSLPHLDSEAEMRRFFGSKVVNASKAGSKQARGSRAVVAGVKSHLTKPEPTWRTASQGAGLSLRSLTLLELNEKERRSKIRVSDKGERWWTVEYSKSYRNVTKAFVATVMSGDPERFYQILSRQPWQADTLLQMAEICRHREEHSTCVDYLNRALFSYERCLIGAFSFTSGCNRLDFDQVENRPFYLALSRMATDLQRRGCSRSAFEFAKLLLSLDPYTDPHGALLYLDYLAVKAGMHDWLLDIWDLHESMAISDEGNLWEKFNVTALPGWSYARALALRARETTRKENHEPSTEALKEAIQAFPPIVPLLADKIDVVLPGELRGNPYFRVHVDTSNLIGFEKIVHLLSHLYTFRSAPLWKLPDNADWFKKTAITTYNSYNYDERPHPLMVRLVKQFGGEQGIANLGRKYPNGRAESHLLESGLARSIYRHASLLPDANAVRRLTAFFPRELHFTSLSCDLLPPLTAISSYDEQFFEGCEDIFAFRPLTRREREIDARRLARMIDDMNLRHQLQGVYEARPDIQRLFPGGVAQFAQVAVQFGEEFWDNLFGGENGVAEHVVLDVEGAGNLPGAFEGDNGEVDEGHDAVHHGHDDNVDNADNEERNVHEQGSSYTAGNQPPEDLHETGDEEVSSEDDGGEEDTAPILPVRIWQNLINRFWGGGGSQDVVNTDSTDED